MPLTSMPSVIELLKQGDTLRLFCFDDEWTAECWYELNGEILKEYTPLWYEIVKLLESDVLQQRGVDIVIGEE